jgi:hypothetical protein
MSLADQIEETAKEHDDPQTIASIVGAKFDRRADLIEALVEEILGLKAEIPSVKQIKQQKALEENAIAIRDAYSDAGPAPTEGEEADPFTVVFDTKRNGFHVTFDQGGERRKLLVEQQKDDISITCCSQPEAGPDARVFLRDDRTEFHAIRGREAHESTPDTMGFRSTHHHASDESRP